MSNNENIKGALVNHNKKKKMLKPEPVQFSQLKDPFKFSPASTESVEQPENEPVKDELESLPPRNQPEEIIIEPPIPEVKIEKKSVVGKKNAAKTIKVSQKLHTQIGVLGKFMDETKTYAIIDHLILTYVETQLSDRQKKQFNYMSEFLNDN